MAIIISVHAYQKGERKFRTEVPWWDESELRKKYEFKKVYFAGEIDHHLEVTKEQLKDIHKEQLLLDKNWNNPYLIKSEEFQKLDFMIKDHTEYDKIEIELWVWYSGY